MSQLAENALEAARDAVGRRAWDEAFDLLKAADEEESLAPEALELLSQAALWKVDYGTWFPTAERAYAGYVKADNKRRAAFMAVSLAHEYKNQLQSSTAKGWMSRAKRLLDEEEEGPEHGYWALQQALLELGDNDFDEAYRLSKHAEELGRRFGDRNLEIRGIQRQGASLIEKGDVVEGQMLLDEASAAAFGGELDPYSTLVVYCNAIGACRDVADFERAGEWTERAHQFADSVSMNSFPGMCRVNRAEVMRFKGDLAGAGEEAARAGEELRAWCPRIAGAAFYELGEARLRLGDLHQAEASFREADEYGREPEPGLSLLRLAQGNAKGAFASIRRALSGDTMGVAGRARLLPAGVDIAIAAGELEQAEDWAADLTSVATAYDTSALKAAAEYSRGSIALARGDTAAAYPCLKQARALWEATGATYDVARARVQIGRAAQLEGDEDTAMWEFEAAAVRFERLGAVRDAERVADLLAVKRIVSKTFVFTDIVRSTDLLQSLEDRHWANALRQHDAALRTIFADWQGHVVDHTGDGFFVAFEEAEQAVGAAVAVQRMVDQEFVFDVRIGLHSDGALLRDKNYHGKGVHAAARIGAAAEGREILGSRPTMESVADVATANHRSIVLKGFREPVEVCSIVWERR
ncbi:MAG TPA: hypothetical protein VH306_02520 [Gaiellaceae bacterium]|jgi:class 3 adenylate cyclase